MNKIKWTPEMDEQLRRLYPLKTNSAIGKIMSMDYITIKRRAFALKLKKPDGWTNNGRFTTGSKPWNTGTKGVCKPNAGCYAKGTLPHNTKPVGTVVIVQHKGQSFHKIKITERSWAYMHRLEWQKHHGPIPADHNITFRDGNTLNYDISNLGIVSKRDNARKNHNLAKAAKKLTELYEIERVRHVYGLPPKSGHGRRMFRPSGKNVIVINTKPLAVDL